MAANSPIKRWGLIPATWNMPAFLNSNHQTVQNGAVWLRRWGPFQGLHPISRAVEPLVTETPGSLCFRADHSGSIGTAKRSGLSTLRACYRVVDMCLSCNRYCFHSLLGINFGSIVVGRPINKPHNPAIIPRVLKTTRPLLPRPFI